MKRNAKTVPAATAMARSKKDDDGYLRILSALQLKVCMATVKKRPTYVRKPHT